MANNKIDIPYWPEFAERFAIRFVIGLIIKAARKNLNFEKVRAGSKDFVVPESDKDIEMMVAG